VTLVLLFNTAAPAHLAARLHALPCAKVSHALSNPFVVVVRDDTESEADDLRERGYSVKRCKCCEECGS
jgi:hypothetical protein